MMIKLLVLCLLATIVTMEDATHEASKETSLSTTAVTKESPKATHSTHHSTLHASAVTETKESPKVTHSTHHHSTPHPSAVPDAKESPEVTHSTHHHSTPHPSAVPDNKTTSSHPTAALTCSCTTGADCHEHHCTTKASKHFCVTTAEDNTLDRTRRHSMNRTCGDNTVRCNETIAITLSEQVYWRSLTRCCNHDGCNSQSLEVPPADTAQSKLVCPSCFAVDNSTCTQFHRMKCAASETQCINVSGTIENGDHSNSFTGQGCASPSAIHFNGITLVFGNATYSFSHITMSDATDSASPTPRSVSFAFLLSSFVGLLQANSIY